VVHAARLIVSRQRNVYPPLLPIPEEIFMLRVRKCVLLRAIAPLALLALSALNGCIVYTDPVPASPPRRARSRPASRPPQQQGTPTLVGRTGASSGGATSAPPAGDTTPRITSSIIFGNGSGGAFQGQAYVIPETTRTMPNFDGLVPFATLFTDSFNISSQPFSGGFPGVLKQDDWFGIRYEGSFFIPNDGQFAFEVTSDDGAILYIDGQQVVDVDGIHAAVTSSGRKELRSGNHRLRLDYFQSSKGKVALSVFVTMSGQKVPLVGVRPR
jgi:hypothetical protein